MFTDLSVTNVPTIKKASYPTELRYEIGYTNWKIARDWILSRKYNDDKTVFCPDGLSVEAGFTTAIKWADLASVFHSIRSNGASGVTALVGIFAFVPFFFASLAGQHPLPEHVWLMLPSRHQLNHTNGQQTRQEQGAFHVC